MQCLGTTRNWLFFEHAGSVVAVDSVSLDVTPLVVGEAADALIASATEQEWRPPEPNPVLDAAQLLASAAFADTLPPSPTFPVPVLASTGLVEYSVPDDVSECAKRGLRWRRIRKRSGSKVCSDSARLLAQGDDMSLGKVRNIALYWATQPRTASIGEDLLSDTELPSDERIEHDLWGGSAGREWAQSIVASTIGQALIAAGYDIDAGMEDDVVSDEESDQQNPNEVHRFEPALGNIICTYCGKGEFNEIHDFLAVDYSNIDVDPNKSHLFSESPADSDVCEICNRAVNDDLHKQAALASYYEFKELYDGIYSLDASNRQRRAEMPDSVTAASVLVQYGDEDDNDVEEEELVTDPMSRAGLARDEADQLFWVRTGHEDEDPLTYFVSHPGDDEMIVDGVYVFDGNDFYRLDTNQMMWVPEDVPAGEHLYSIDDDAAYVTISALLYSPEPFDLHEVDPGESYLMDQCVPHLDYESLDRGLITAAGAPLAPPAPGGVPTAPPAPIPNQWAGYTAEERARNAAKQGRDSGGKFAPSGGGGGAAAPAENKPAGPPKARFAATKPPLTPAEVTAFFTGFPDYVAQQRGAAPSAPAPAPVTAAAAPPMAPPAQDAAPAAAPVPEPAAPAAETATASPEQSDVAPINMAIMDPGDPSAVMELVSLVPASSTSVVPKLFRRVAGGIWQEDLGLLRQMQGLNPPLLHQLADTEYTDVLTQVDQFFSKDVPAPAPAAAPAPSAPPVMSLYGPYGELVSGGVPVLVSAGDDYSEKSVVVAAVPSDDDPIWGASSEKKPHMTMLFFGPAEGADMESIRSAVAAAAAAIDGPLTIPVTGREDLGDDSADVITVDPGALLAAREALLSQDAVRTAYESVDQYPEYTPHVTLGYPDNPAKGDPPEEITFDRLALWDGDYMGDEFPLGGGEPITSAGVPGIADTPSDIAAVEKLKKYWTIGKGGTIKIRWNTPGDWTRCNRHLRKYMGPRAKGYCAKLHKDMTGVWPGDRRNIGKRNRSKFSMIGDGYDVASTAEIVDRAAKRAEDTRSTYGYAFTAAASAIAPVGGAKFVIPVLAPVGVSSGDGREFSADALSYRELPIPLLWQVKTMSGHDESIIVGRIDNIDRLEDGSLGNARGVFDVGPYGQEAERMVRDKFLRGVSVDLDEFEAQSKEDKSDKAKEAGDTDEDAGRIKPGKMIITNARAMAATLVAKPAFQECMIEIDDDDVVEEIAMVADGTYIADPSTDQEYKELVQSALVAAGIPLHPPREWFNDPKLTEKTPLTVHEDGRVFGHIATWDVDHIGLPFSTRPPKSSSNYAYFHTGVLRTDDGSDVPVGQLTLVGGHASLDANAAAAARHYDDTASAFADIRIGEDRWGIWASGALRTTVTGDQLRAIRASAPSGDWRPINGRLELVAVCQVNTPGFPTTRVMVAGGEMYALVAAGTDVLNRIRADRASEADGLSSLADRLATLESDRAAERSKALDAARAAIIERVAPTRDAVTERYRESMSSLRDRVMTESDDEASLFRDYSPEKREDYAKKGVALKDGSYPINNVGDLKNAIRAYGRAKNKAAVRRHIRKRARALGKTDLIPASWSSASLISEEFSAMAYEPADASLFNTYSDETRDAHVRKGWALADGSFSIATVQDLRSALLTYGRCEGDKSKIRRHIRKRALALGKSDILPESWSEAASVQDDGFMELMELYGPLIAAYGRYPDGTPWDPKQHPRDESGRFKEALARIKKAAIKAHDQEIIDATDVAERAEKTGNLDAAQEAARQVLKRVDANAKDIGDFDTAKELREGYKDLGSAVANLPLAMGDLNQKFRFTELPPDLQGLIKDLLSRVLNRLEPEAAEKAAGEIKSFISGVDLLSQPEISAELSRMLRYLI